MKKYLIQPFGDFNLLQNKIFEGPFLFLKKELENLNVEINTVDMHPLEISDKILFMNYNKSTLQQCMLKKIPKEKLVLFLWDPECVIPEQYDKKIWSNFGQIFSLREDYNELGIKHFKYPQGQTVSPSGIPFQKRKFLTLINANKFSYVKGEYYSLRRELIDFFDKECPQFDLFGRDWNKPITFNLKRFGFYLVAAIKRNSILKFLKDVKLSLIVPKSYKGELEDKYKTLSNYKFCISFENEGTYITEKLFDCLSTGTVPIYLGPDEIYNYVPSNCFIDYKKFGNPKELLDFISNYSDSDYEKFIKTTKDFLDSEGFKQWTPKEVFKEIARSVCE